MYISIYLKEREREERQNKKCKKFNFEETYKISGIKDRNLISRGKEILAPFIPINQIPIVNLEFST